MRAAPGGAPSAATRGSTPDQWSSVVLVSGCTGTRQAVRPREPPPLCRCREPTAGRAPVAGEPVDPAHAPAYDAACPSAGASLLQAASVHTRATWPSVRRARPLPPSRRRSLPVRAGGPSNCREQPSTLVSGLPGGARSAAPRSRTTRGTVCGTSTARAAGRSGGSSVRRSGGRRSRSRRESPRPPHRGRGACHGGCGAPWPSGTGGVASTAASS